MAKKKKVKDKTLEFDGLLDKTARDSLNNMVDEMLQLATNITEEYKSADLAGELTELSGSVVEISENSPFLNELFEGDSWKKVISMGTAFNKMSGSKDDASE